MVSRDRVQINFPGGWRVDISSAQIKTPRYLILPSPYIDYTVSGTRYTSTPPKTLQVSGQRLNAKKKK